MVSGKSIARAAFIIMAATLVGRLLGFIRETVMAAEFGASLATDAYKVAYNLPYILGVTITGAFNAAFIPIFTQSLLEDEREKSWRMASSVINIVFVFFTLLVVAGIFLSPWVVKLMAPGFKGQAFTLTTELMRIIFPTLVFMALAGITSGMLNSQQHFLMPSLGPMVASIGVIASIYLLAPSMGVYGLAVGTLVGFAGQFFIQVPQLFKQGFRYHFCLDWRDPAIRRLGKLILPVLVGVGVGQISIIVDQRFASHLAEGSVAALNFANRLMQLPLGLFVAALAIPLFPAFSAFAAKNDLDSIKKTLVKGLNLYALIMIPATVGLMVLSKPIVKLLFERGAFDAQDTEITAYALFFLSLGLIGFAVRDIFTRVFYSLKDTTTPVAVAALAVGLNVALNIFLVKRMGVGGLALGTSLAVFANILGQGWLLRRKIGPFLTGEAVITWVKVGAASAIMAVAVWFTHLELARVLTFGGARGQVVLVGGAILVGALVYGVLVLLFRIPEVGYLINMAREKLNRGRLKEAK